jgi:uncharacterized PurR-regulated membrane protein YhhQ (DUF165 family)
VCVRVYFIDVDAVWALSATLGTCLSQLVLSFLFSTIIFTIEYLLESAMETR